MRLNPPLTVLFLWILAASAQAQITTDFMNYESPPIHPIALSSDGERLFTVHGADHRLSVWTVVENPAQPTRLFEVPVGLEPVSVAERTADEVWVVNWLSDNISIVSLSERRVTATLPVGDAPCDVVFAGGRAFVTSSTADQVRVFDASTLADVGTIDVFGKDPRALAVSPDGSKVYAVITRSGNRSTIVRAGLAPPQPPPTNASLPAPPQVARIVDYADPAFAAQTPWVLPDNDVVEIDVATLTISRNYRGVGTNNFGITVDDTTGELWVANTDARNLIRFEPNLRGHTIDSRVTRIVPGVPATVTPIDLNPGIDYNTLPNPAAASTALAEPTDVLIDTTSGRLYVAAQGTDRIGILDGNGAVLSRIEVGNTPGAAVDTQQKRGPRALVLDATGQWLYVYNRLSLTYSVIDTTTSTVASEQPLSPDEPTPSDILLGRKFLYDAKLSGNGTMSCAACHVDGEMDGLAWDLGDPGGEMQSPPPHPNPVLNALLEDFHPMKGPMTTQTFRGLNGVGPLHWRGDRASFVDFNGTFDDLLGGPLLSQSDMNLFASFATSIAFPPNPAQPLDRQFATEPSDANQAAGLVVFTTLMPTPGGNMQSCTGCHALPNGTTGVVQPPDPPRESMKIPHLRNLYRKRGFSPQTSTLQKLGFGNLHDGVGTLEGIVGSFGLPATDQDDLLAFLLAFDTGTAPAVGYQTRLDAATAATTDLVDALDLLESQAASGDIDVIAKGELGMASGLLYDAVADNYMTDVSGFGPFTRTQLINLAGQGLATLNFTGVPPSTGERSGIDRDRDGTRDGDEGLSNYGPSTPGCAGDVDIFGNSEPRIGNEGFAVIGTGGPPTNLGVGLASFLPGFDQSLGITLLVDLSFTDVIVVELTSDSRGTGIIPVPLPNLAVLDGLSFYVQYLWADPCAAPIGVSTSPGLQITMGS